MLLYLILIAFMIALGLTPICKWVAPYCGFLDQPSARKMQKRAMPLLGGLAIFAGVLGALPFLGAAMLSKISALLWPIIYGAAAMFLLGLWDDRRRLSWQTKLFLQVITACVVSISIFPAEEYQLSYWVGLLASICWVVFITNACNLMDNMDGLCAGVSSLMGLALLAISLCVATTDDPLGNVAGLEMFGITALCLSLIGASLGFLVFNFSPAKIFMGDAGSLTLGFILSAVSVSLCRAQADSLFAFAPVVLMAFALPIFDTTLVSISRLRRGLNPLSTPGKDHLSHRLLARGFRVPVCVLIVYAAQLVCSIAAMIAAEFQTQQRYLVLALVVLPGLYYLYKFEFSYEEKNSLH